MKPLNQTKHIFFLSLVFCLFGCNNQPTEANSLMVETLQVSFSAEQNTKLIPCSAHAAIETLSSQPEWCTAKVMEWNNNTAIEVSVSKNTAAGQARTAIITVSAGTESVQMEVIQASGLPFLNVGTSELRFVRQAGQIQLTVDTNVPFSATPSASWCEAVVDTDATVDNMTVSVSENDGMDTRYSEIVIAAPGFSNVKINVVQTVHLTSDLDDDEKYKYTTTGHLIFHKAEELTSLTAIGPFIRLANGSLFRSSGTVSWDEGKTWLTSYQPDPQRFNLGSPVVVQTHTGTIVVCFSNGREISPLNWNNITHEYDPNAKLPLYVVYTRNNGQTWSEPLKLHDEWTGMNRELLQTKDGHIVLSTMIMRPNLGRHCVMTYVSSDDGETWTPSNVLDYPSAAGDHGGLMEAAILQSNDNRLWMLIRTNYDYFYESYSSDNGLTWSAYQKTGIDASSSPGALLRLQSGRIILVWNRLYHEGENSIRRRGGDKNLSEVAASWQRDELSMMYSDDNAKTWSTPFVVAKLITYGSSQLSYPCLFEQSKGVIWITTGNVASGNLKIAIKEDDLPK